MTDSPTSLLVSLRIIEETFHTSSSILTDATFEQLSQERASQLLTEWAKRVIDAAQIDLRVQGREHLEPLESFVIMSNHQSHMDIPCLYRALTPAMRMVAKKELFRIPFFSHAMRRIGIVEVDRQHHQKAVENLRNGSTLLQKGIPIWIAPEGTRSPSGALLPFKKGGFLMALGAGARILPVGIHGTRNVLPIHALKTRLSQRVGVAIGTPIPTIGKECDLLIAQTRSAIASLIAQARALVD